MKRIGKFIVCGLLGKGGMGKVYKIKYPVTGKIGAMKLLDPNPFLVSLLGKTTIEDMFVKEAITMAGIRHPHVVEILDFDSFEGRPYYIMDFFCNNLGAMMGESYETEKPSRAINLDKAIDYTRQILQGLSRLHFSSLIHRDIKPFNILVTDEDQIKICDFGLSKLRHESVKSHSSLKVGSPYYAPPEQEDNPDSVDFSADLYSVGVMLYRMVTGRLPEIPIIPPSLINKDIDVNWDAFILKAMAPLPGNRYTDADRMQDDLDELETNWIKRKQAICAAPAWLFDDHEDDETIMVLRSQPAKIPWRNAEASFETDELMRPRTYIRNRFTSQTEKTVIDLSCNLIWQISGTRFPVNREGAFHYIKQLNDDCFAGISTWRMPTVNELLSLVDRTPEGRSYCVKSIFDSRLKWLWSADRCTYITGWYVNHELGFAGYNDFDSFYHVKAVSTLSDGSASPVF